jgi:hypothetical protein
LRGTIDPVTDLVPELEMVTVPPVPLVVKAPKLIFCTVYISANPGSPGKLSVGFCANEKTGKAAIAIINRIILLGHDRVRSIDCSFKNLFC